MSGYVANTLLLFVSAALVMFMAAGFAMLEAGLVRSKNAGAVCMKNVSLLCCASFAFAFLGYGWMFGGVEGVMWSWGLGEWEVGGNYSPSAFLFFQMVFVATAASVVSGALAERIRVAPFLVFTLVLAGVLYPVTGEWVWGGGWLSELGFYDFAGSTVVHSVGGWAALTGALFLGPRLGRYGRRRGLLWWDSGSSMPLVTLGVLILWFGWFGFNVGSLLEMDTSEAAAAAGRIALNTHMAACGGVLAVLVAARVYYRRLKLPMVLNAAIAGLVSITADPLTPGVGGAVLVGGVGGLACLACSELLTRLRVDDVVGAIPAHLAAGIWGTLAVGLLNEEVTIWAQFVGVVSIGAFMVVGTGLLWWVLKVTMGIRAPAPVEAKGLDESEVGVKAWPEFGGAWRE